MEIKFLDSKDGTKTFSVNSVFYHSSYSPLKEAQRFVDTINISFNPKLIILIEPGIAYCKDFLKQKYPTSKIVIIRLFDFSFDDENNWDYIINKNQINNLSSILFSKYSEEILLDSLILCWNTAQKFFENDIHIIYEQYKSCIEQSKTVLITRQFFEKKWFINSVNFFKYINNVCCIQSKIDIPFFICASGPSLLPYIEIIKKYQNKCFIIALSSSISVLLKNNIKPDLIFTTDGGFYAGQHLKKINNYDIPISATAEAYVQKNILYNAPVLPLKYIDSQKSISTQIFDVSKINCIDAFRNGTVSGTVLSFAKKICTNNIYFFGLDLSSQRGFQHTQPNELELNSVFYDNRIKNKVTRISNSRYNCESLKIYQKWFENSQNNKNVFRVIEKEFKNNSLGSIKDINLKEFEQSISKTKDTKKQYFNFSKICIDKKNVFDFITKNLDDVSWQKQILPADFLSLGHAQTDSEKQLISNRIKSKIEEIKYHIQLIIKE